MKQFRVAIAITVLLFLNLTITAVAQIEEKSNSRSSISGIPVLGYSPETKFMGGAAGICFFRNAGTLDKGRPSSFVPTVIYTEQKQMLIEISTDIYLKQEEYYLHSNISYKKFPNKFFGVGYDAADKFEDLFTSRESTVYIDLLKRLQKELYAGIKLQYADINYDAFEPGGLLSTGNYTGKEGGTIAGLGIQVNIDDRDGVIYPRSGKYIKLAAVLIDDSFGSDYNYKYFFINASKYFSAGERYVLAFNGFFKHMSGNVPFMRLASFHNVSPLRGYYENYYRDMNGASLQAELRTQVYKRLGFVLFAGAGQVAHEISGFRFDRFKPTGGFGFRFKLIPEENLNIRVDFGYGQHSSGFYIGAGEVF